MKMDLIGNIKRNEALIILCVVAMLLYMGIGQVSPVLPLYARQFSINITMIGLIITTFAIASAIIDIPASTIAEKFGRRPILIAGTMVLAVGSLGCALVTNYWLLLLCRFIQGSGYALYTTTGMIMLADISTINNRGQNMSLYTGSAWVGFGLGPMMGGFMAQYFGLQAVFYFYAFFCFLAGVWAYFRLPETRPQPVQQNTQQDVITAKAGGQQGKSLKELLSNPNLILVLLLTFMIFLTNNGSRNQTLPLLAHDRLLLNTGQIGIAMSLIGMVNIAVLLLAGRMSDRVGRKPMVLPGCLLLVAAVVMLSLSFNYWFMLLACVIWGIGIGIAGPTPAAYVADILSREKTSLGMGLFRFMCDLGLVAGPVLCGWLSDLNGYSFSLIINAILLLTITLLFQFIAHEHPSFLNKIAGRK
ncbi:MAG: MFS transporter [Dehalococcoidia bacterium]|nr:MFS transporter [Dehalococcoidia bacterium]